MSSEETRARNREYARRYAEQYRGVRQFGDAPLDRVQIPADVLADRDHRINLPPRPFGDPPLGYSAADRRERRSPSIVHDPLDDLIFAG